jgi:tetratricopeptide (TPR) repeat protein
VLERRLEIESGLVASSETATDGPVNTDLLTAWIDVAVSLDAFQKYDRAREIKESVLEKREKAFGQTHPETLRARQSLALHYGRRNMLREAVEEHQKVLNASEKVYGLAHLMTLDARDEVARLRARLLWKRVKEKQINYGELEREKTALRRIREELVKDWETHFPEHHPRIWTAKNRLYDVVFKFYNHDEAQFRRDNLYKEQLAKKGEDDASTIETWMRLASGFKHMGKTAEAMKIYRQIAAYFAQGSDDKHLLALRAMAKTADLLEGQCSHKDDEEALEILKKLVKVQESLQGPDHPVVQRTKESIHGLQVKLRVDSSLFAESIDGPYKSESEEADAPGLGSRF